MTKPRTVLLVCMLALACVPRASGQALTREQWGGTAVMVSRAAGKWTIAGRKNRVTLDESDFGLKVQAGADTWELAPSSPQDALVRSQGEDFYLRLADARRVVVTPYDTGFKTGVKISLGEWRHAGLRRRGAELDLSLFLTICLEGEDEELVFDAAALEGEATLRQLDWPGALDARAVDYTVLSNGRGTLLPRDWPKEYFPIRTSTPEGKVAAADHSVLQSNVVESWSMSWWGFQRGQSALMFIVETPDDAGQQFRHPAGGPTTVGPRWRATLGRFGYPRTCRAVFFARGNYVDMAKRYRRRVLEAGRFVSLAEKIARTPASDRYNTKDVAENYSLTTFDERARQLRELKTKGFGRLLVMASGWPHLGYDRQHPDPFPPPEKAGGWEGLKRLADTCRELGYTFVLHDQYRDYYWDAPSYDPQFAIHEEDMTSTPQAFAGSRFGDWKEGHVPFMRHWDGGPQGYLNARFQLGHLVKNNRLLFEHGVRPQGIYIDVIGYVPPDEDFNPEHPTTRAEAMAGQAALLNWSRQNLGVVLTEAGSDWVLPYVDSVNSSGGGSKAVAVPLYQLVYHDAIVVSFSSRDVPTLLRGLLYGGVPELSGVQGLTDEKTLALIRRMAALHERVALLEMTRHEFLDAKFRRERTTFADGTTVTVDWDSNTYEVRPELAPES